MGVSVVPLDYRHWMLQEAKGTHIIPSGTILLYLQILYYCTLDTIGLEDLGLLDTDLIPKIGPVRLDYDWIES